MNNIKTKEEIEIIRQGGKILARILGEVVQVIRPGVSTGELEEIACRLMEEAGGRPAFKNHQMPDGSLFPTALCASINDEVVHGAALPSRVLKEGDIIGLDVGMEYPLEGNFKKNKYSKKGGYYTDMAATIAVGEVGEQVVKLLSVTKKALELGIEQVKPGNTLNDIGRAIQRYVEANGFSVVRELVGHGVGYDVHEEPQVPNFEIIDKSMKNMELKSGMVIAIEPMVNMGGWRIDSGDDGFSIVTADGSLSAHFEHTVAVTEEGYEIMTI
jgi:methionyl aminopeptidase